MHLTSLILCCSITASSLLSHAFPLAPQRPAVRRRATYSVVAVDGGSAATSSLSNVPAATTITDILDETHTITAPAVTLTPSTKTIVSTALVSEAQPTKTIEISVTRDTTETLSYFSSLPKSTQTLSYSVVNADSTPPIVSTTISVTQTTTSSTTVDCNSSTAVSTSKSTPPSVSSTTSTLSTSTSYSPGTTMTLATPSIAAAEASIPAEGSSLPAGLVPPPFSVSVTLTFVPTATPIPYDNGVWHTTYRSWNVTSTALGSSATAASTGGLSSF